MKLNEELRGDNNGDLAMAMLEWLTCFTLWDDAYMYKYVYIYTYTLFGLVIYYSHIKKNDVPTDYLQ